MNGIGVNLEALQPFVDALDPSLEVIRFDVPGAGGSPVPLIPYRLYVHAWLVAKMLDKLGYAQVDVLGISWGGALAQQFAFQYASRCQRLILVSTVAGGCMVPGKFSVLAKMLTPRRFKDATYMEQVAGELYGGSMRTNTEYARDFARNMHSSSSSGYFYQLLGGAGWVSFPWLFLLRQPTLIMHGDDDPIVPLVNARILHRLILHSQLHIFHDGHLGLMTKAEELSQVVEEFLVSHAS
jgi:poly(3-hydroxyalkanoate) depolymerase